eukprot:2148933-Pleurochrysis_carterae.AAC.6
MEEDVDSVDGALYSISESQRVTFEREAIGATEAAGGSSVGSDEVGGVTRVVGFVVEWAAQCAPMTFASKKFMSGGQAPKQWDAQPLRVFEPPAMAG